MKKLKLSPEYALSLEWSKKAYDKRIIDGFLKYIDLSSGLKLLQECTNICRWYDEVLINEIFFTRKFINSEFSREHKKRLIINLGAGNSLMSLQLLNDYYSSIDKIIELDSEGMDEKEELYNRYYNKESEKIKCVTANITCTSILSFLSSMLQDFYVNTPCIILMNNMSHHLGEKELKNILTCFRSKDKNNILVFDYTLPPTYPDSEDYIPNQIFRTVQNKIKTTKVISYSKETIFHLFSSMGCELIEDVSIESIESYRSGSNKYFFEGTNNWVRCSAWKL